MRRPGCKLRVCYMFWGNWTEVRTKRGEVGLGEGKPPPSLKRERGCRSVRGKGRKDGPSSLAVGCGIQRHTGQRGGFQGTGDKELQLADLCQIWDAHGASKQRHLCAEWCEAQERGLGQFVIWESCLWGCESVLSWTIMFKGVGKRKSSQWKRLRRISQRCRRRPGEPDCQETRKTEYPAEENGWRFQIP